jgi:hypothetical protein
MRNLAILDWSLVAIQLAAPVPVAILVAWFFWRKGRWAIGNVVGSGVVLLVTLVCFGEQFATQLRASVACDEAGLVCVMHPSAFIQLAIFVLIAFVEISLLYVVGLVAEERRRRRTMWQ